ncbi:unnamed protein product [Sphagnum balticum]
MKHVKYVIGLFSARDFRQAKHNVRYRLLWTHTKNTANPRKPELQLDVDIKPRGLDGAQWHNITDAAYIPSNKRNLLRIDIAEEMGLDIRTTATIEIYWRFTHDARYTYSAKFWIVSDLPHKENVIFGEQPPPDPGYPNPFEDNRLVFAKVHIKSRTNSWGRLKEKSFSWGSKKSTERGHNSRRSSFLRRKTSLQPHALAADRCNPSPPQIPDTSVSMDDVERGHHIQNAPDCPMNQNYQSARGHAVDRIAYHPAIDRFSGDSSSSDWICIDICNGLPEETRVFKESGSHEANATVSLLPCSPQADLSETEPVEQAIHTRPMAVKSTESQNVLKELDEGIAVGPAIGANSSKEAFQAGSEDRTHGNFVQSPNLKGSDEPSHPLLQKRPHLSMELSTLQTTREAQDPNSPEGETDARLRNIRASDLGNRTDSVSKRSTIYPDSSFQVVSNQSSAPESPTSHNNIITHQFGGSPNLFLDSTMGKEIQPGAAKASDHTFIQQEARYKIRARKRGKAPRIKSGRSDVPQASQNANLTPAPAASEEWTYEAGARGHYHVDSDTGSTLWYPDSDSEDS